MIDVRSVCGVVPALGMAAVVVGCASGTDNLRRRAAFDLDCSAGDLRIQSLGGRHYGVRGCGCTAAYVATHTDMWSLQDNTFVLNNVSGDGCAVASGGESR